MTRPGDLRSENADMSNEKSCEKTRSPASGRLSAFSQSEQSESVPKETPKGLPVRWVHESDEVALTTEPCLDLGANWMIGPRDER